MENADDEFLGTVTSLHEDATDAGGKPWVVLQMNNQFKIDSSADVTMIVKTDYQETRDEPLQKPT